MIEQIVKDGVITPRQLQTLSAKAEHAVRILDATFTLPNENKDPEADYKGGHIEGAVFFDVKSASDPDSDLPNMRPPAPVFEAVVGALGINNDDLVVIYGQGSMGMGPARVWWLFKTFGHNRVCILDGGLTAWRDAGLAVTDEVSEVVASVFKAVSPPARVTVSQDEVADASAQKSAMILDARPAQRFGGETPEPRAGMRAGHIPGAVNIPYGTLLNDDGTLKSRDVLNTIFADAGIREDTALIATCGSGMTACMIIFALYHVGRQGVSLYDGSWSDWGREDAGTPIAAA